jgi:hypothetical protein
MPDVIASTFADPADLEAFRKAKAEGKSDRQAFKVGDNGVGFWGDQTSDTDICMCALPPEDWEKQFGRDARGKKVAVTYKKQTVVGELRDRMPSKKNVTNGAGIDLNPAFAAAFKLKPPFLLGGFHWDWAD